MFVSSVLTALVLTAGCSEEDPVTFTFTAKTTLEGVAAWASKNLCEPHSVESTIAKKTLPLALSGTVSRKHARKVLEATLAAAEVELRAERMSVVLAAPKVAPGDEQCSAWAKALRVVSEEERAVSREVFDAPWGECALRGARLVPNFRGGSVDGMKVFAIRPDSLWAAAGFLNGDALLTVNGLPLQSPEQGLAAVDALKSASRLEFSLLRRNQPARVVITIEGQRKRE